jgi:hypothetical protein
MCRDWFRWSEEFAELATKGLPPNLPSDCNHADCIRSRLNYWERNARPGRDARWERYRARKRSVINPEIIAATARRIEEQDRAAM